MNKKEHALALAANGWMVFPLKPNDKRPATRNGQDDAVCSTEEINAWWDANPDYNIGIHCGDSGLYVIDIDRSNGKNGLENWQALLDENGKADTYTVETQSGGYHCYYWMPEGEQLTNTAGKLAEHIDTRGNGYVVAPGSTINGREYKVVRDVSIAELPQWIVDKVKKTRKAPPPPGMTYNPAAHAPSGDVIARVRQLADELANAPDGTGNATAARIAFMVGGYVGAGQLTHQVAEQELLAAVAGWTWHSPDDYLAMQRTIARQIIEGSATPRPWEKPRKTYERPSDSKPKADKADVIEDYPPEWDTDIGQADWFLSHQPGVIFVPRVGYLVWDGKRWAPTDSDAMEKIITTFYKQQFELALARWAKDTSDENNKKLVDFIHKRMGVNKIRATAAMVKAEACMGKGEEAAGLLDSHPHLLNTPNGVVNLQTGEVSDHDPGLYLTKITAGNYRPDLYRRDPHADWVKASEALPEEHWDYMQLRVGASLVADSRPDNMIIMYGALGNNGKSSLADNGLAYALGDYGYISQPQLLESSKGGSNALTPDKANLRGKRWVMIEEIGSGEASLDEDEIKRLVKTPTISARTLNEKPIQFKATHTLFATSNTMPTVIGTQDSTWERMLIIPFPYKFIPNPKAENERQADQGLGDRLIDGLEGQHDAMITWAVDGALRYYTNKTAIKWAAAPASLRKVQEQWREDNDPIRAFFNARLEHDRNSCVATTDLYAELNSWLESAKLRSWSKRVFIKRLTSHPDFANVERGRPAIVTGLSRPPGAFFVGNELPERPEIFTGIRFKTEG